MMQHLHEKMLYLSTRIENAKRADADKNKKTLMCKY